MSGKEQVKEESLVEIKRLKIEGENFFRISNHDEMRPFFMSIVSDSNHWIFISSNGGITAGRKSAEYALFPYYTADKITESYDNTGSKTIFQIHHQNEIHIWEPFSERNNTVYEISRNLYKNAIGNKIIFEEINHHFALTFRYEWNTSNIYGFVRKSSLENKGDLHLQINILDGIQNIMPDGVSCDLQNSTSILVDAYKRNELDIASGLGIFALSAIIVDKAEPSEALKANIAWSVGLDKPLYLLSSLQIDAFRKGVQLVQEEDVKAEKAAYFISKEISLSPSETKKWMIVADVNQSQADVVAIINEIQTNKELSTLIEEDILLGSKRLIELNASSDGIQLSADVYRDTRHFSNTLFNIMRGGIFDFNYQIEKWDLLNYLAEANKGVFEKHKDVLENLNETFTVVELEHICAQIEDKNFKRLCTEYLPLKFSRRHGDPSRPWNKFSINTRSAIDYSKRILDYEGNWRDIFQNWEALALSYPGFTRSMIHKFLNATTFEGYNPYRVTKAGFDWETVEPDNPWSYIGYWGDHQIIYLLKLLEINEKYFPGQLSTQFNKEQFVYANVPYKIKSYAEILKNAKDTIEFDEHLNAEIKRNMHTLGSDAALLVDQHQNIYTVNFIEKILATILAKLSNFIPGAGIWMNTQRPEWNDANNALVGNGVSMVTLYYLRRFMVFFEKLIDQTKEDRIELSNELIIFFKAIHATLEQNESLLKEEINDAQRKTILDNFGQAGSDYREHIYKQSFWSEKRTISYRRLRAFVKVSLAFIEHTINANKREDDMYHAYNLMSIKSEEVHISYLNEMLEGQVAVLSSGYLSPKEAIKLLDSMKNSALFRPDQYSYLLYPNKQLPKFLQKNKIPKEAIRKLTLIDVLLAAGEKSIVEKDMKGEYHFNGNLKNAGDLSNAIDQLDKIKYGIYLETEKKALLEIYEQVFDHKSFTGRSGTFYGYEGLGSIYWHMVSKLQLAVQEVCLMAIEKGEPAEVIGKLLEHYYEINAGVGVHKSPKLYGAFPTDPYSHTPSNKGAQQPGMTGQVKEDIISRFGELGVFVLNGTLYFNPCLLRKDEFTTGDRMFHYVTIHKEHKTFSPLPGSLCFTYCQVPIIYRLSDKNYLEIEKMDGTLITNNSLQLDAKTSSSIFNRTGEISKITVYVEESILK